MPHALAQAAAEYIKSKTGVETHEIAVVLGSGWSDAAAHFGEAECELPYSELPGFTAPSVAGHGGVARSIDLGGGKRALVFLGRTHLYEGRGVDAVAHPVRTAKAAGARALLLTNACGGLNPEWRPGTPVLISDHINFTGQTPLVGANFVDVTEVYSLRLRALAKSLDPSLAEGVYVGFAGPQYETPAEIEMVRRWGGTLVGMSTVLEAIAARAEGLEILGLSLVTNLAAGMSGQTLNHKEVVEAGQQAAERMGRLLAQLIREV